MSKLIKLVAARAEKFKEMNTLVQENPTMDDTVKAKYDGLKNDFDDIDRKIDIAKAQENMDAFDMNTILPVASKKAIATQDYRNGFDAYVAGFEITEFKAAMTEGTAADGGYIVPETYQTTVLEKLNTLSQTRAISNVLATTSTKNVPVEGDAPTFAWIDEAGAYGETKSTFANKQLKAWKLGGIIKVSDELLQDNMISFAEYMAGQIAKGIDKAEAPAFCTGDGSNKPSGYVTSLTATADTTTTAIAAITAAEVAKIYYALPEAYRKRATWRLHTKTLQAIRELNDGNGGYFYKDEIKNGMIEGRPYVIDDNLPEMATGAKFLVFGDFNFYQIADRGEMEIRRMNEAYAGNGLVGFRVTVRVDAKRMVDEAFVVAQNA